MKKAPLITLGCVIAVCGLVYMTGGTTDAHELTTRGLQELGRGDFGAAADDLERAVDALEVGSPEYDRARRGLVDALARIEPDRARLEFLAYAEGGAELDARDYRSVATSLHKGGGSTAAAQLLDVAVVRFPDDARLLESHKATILEEAQKTGKPEELEKLRSLAYVGD